MEVLWRECPRTAEELAAELGPAQGWSEATVKTLVNRLLKKKAVSAERDGRRYLYRPALQREDWVAGESAGFVDRMFDGRLAPLVSHFSQARKLSAEDVAELKRLIAELDDE